MDASSSNRSRELVLSRDRQGLPGGGFRACVAPLWNGSEEGFRQDLLRRVRAAIVELDDQAARAEAEMIRLRGEIGRLQEWLVAQRAEAMSGRRASA